MEKKDLNDLIIKKERELNRSNISNVMKLKDGSIIKIFNPDYLILFSKVGIDIEKKILDSENERLDSRIKRPTSVLYLQDLFVGYRMDEAKGNNIDTFNRNLSVYEKGDLNLYANIYSNIEDVVKKSPNIVFTDLCTPTNIFIDNKNQPNFCDYDGFQVGKHLSGHISTSLGNQEQYNNSKYRKGDYFTKELDKKSLITLYFYMTFGIDLGTVGQYNPMLGCTVTLDFLFDVIGLKDDDIAHKTYKTFSLTDNNEYLGDDVFRLAEKNNMIAIPVAPNTYVKMLVKK